MPTEPAIVHMRDRLVEASVDLFHRQGFMATTVRQITSDAGVTPGALYNHFPSKEAVLAEIIVSSHTDLIGRLDAAVDRAASPSSQLSEFVTDYVDYYTSYPRISRVSIRDMEFLPTKSFDEVVGLRRRTRRLLEDVIEAGAESGEFELVPAGQMPPARAAAMAIMDMCVRVTEPYWVGSVLSTADIADVHARLARRMVGSRQDS